MSGRFAFLHKDEFVQFDFGGDHPLNPMRVILFYELAKQAGVLDVPIVKALCPPAATIDDLCLFHTREYVDFVARTCERGTGYLDMGDTPAFKGCVEASLHVVGASLEAVNRVMAGKAEHACNFAGGLHHAHPDRASGFCVFNDPAIAIAHLQKNLNVGRIMYLDVDAHHGDGVMYGYYADGRLLDVDFHEDGRYLFPGSGGVRELGDGPGKNLKVNIPLPPRCNDASFLSVFDSLVPKLVRWYRPEIILWQCGGDGHAGDPITHLELTNRTYRTVAERIHALAHEVCDGRLVVFGGGGYNLANVTRIWALVAATVAGASVDDELPTNWRTLFQGMTGMVAPTRFSDDPGADDLAPGVSDIVDFLQRTLPVF
ncbi:MAG: acetoin utilization protein AcuC [Chloroflexi bacterium]|nr:acetoin utilization protein AcuC [Chloroflexota bacterium]